MATKTKSPEYARFQDALRAVLQVSKKDYLVAEEQHRREQAGKPRRGPKPKPSQPSASDRVSDSSDTDL
jgi:hypothetical protein